MSRRNIRRSLVLENLESREVLSSGGPSAEAQYMLYLLNQARTNPAEMADRVTSNLDDNVTATINYYNVNLQAVKNTIASAPAKPPLAWNDTLASTATGQSQYQATNGIQTHQGPNEANLEGRLNQAGYTNRTTDGENAYAYSTSVDEAMEAFLIDWGVSSNGHRDNILQPNTSADNAYRDVGIGIVATNNNGLGPYVITQDFGAQQGEKAQLVGVVYNDPTHTHFMTEGSGQGGVTINVTNKTTGATTSVQTWDAGGYQVSLDPGDYTVTAVVGNQVVNSQDVTIGTQNVEVDFDLSDPWQGTPAVTTPAVTAAAVTAAPMTTVTPVTTTPPAPTTPPVTITPVVNNGTTSNSSTPVQVAVPTVSLKKSSSWVSSWTSAWTAVNQ